MRSGTEKFEVSDREIRGVGEGSLKSWTVKSGSSDGETVGQQREGGRCRRPFPDSGDPGLYTLKFLVPTLRGGKSQTSSAC